MLVLALETGILILLIKMFTDNEVGFWLPLFTALATAIGTVLLAAFCVGLMGLWGILVGVLLSAVLLAGCLTILFGVEFKSSLIIGGIFVFAHVGIEVVLYLMLGH